MHREDVQDLLDRRDVLLDTIATGVSDRDRPFLVAELGEVRAALASVQPYDRDGNHQTRDASRMH